MGQNRAVVGSAERRPLSDRRRVVEDLEKEADAELLRAWHAGNDHAGEVLFERHYEAVVRFFRNKTIDPDDLVQRTFVTCVETSQRYRGDSKFRTFLLGIANNLLLKHYRSQAGPRNHDSLEELSVEALGQTPTELLAGRDEQRLLLAALRRLPFHLQVTLELRYWEDLKQREIAEVLGLPEGTIKTRIRRGKQLLEEILGELADTAQQLRSTVTRLDEWAELIRRDMILDGDRGGG